MVNSIWGDIKQQFQNGNMLIQIILVNTGIFVAVNLLHVILFFIFQGEAGTMLTRILRWFMASFDLWHNIKHPWSPLTYMFLHEGLFHFAMNMFILYIYGRLFQDLLGTRRTLVLYLLGGFMGFGTYVISSFILPGFIGQYLLGASAGVWAVAMATTVLRPDYPIHLILIGQVRLKYITLVLALLSIFSIVGNNTGGEIAHLGGMFAGWLFMYFLTERGTDLAVPFNNVWDKIAGFFGRIWDKLRGKPRLRTRHKSDSTKDWEAFRHGRNANARSDDQASDHQERVDQILDKINRSGYSSLSKEEKEFLFKASNKK